MAEYLVRIALKRPDTIDGQSWAPGLAAKPEVGTIAGTVPSSGSGGCPEPHPT